MTERSWLPASSYVVMGLLSFRPNMTGYELRLMALDSIRFFWSAPAMSQIYRELDRLETAGHVIAVDESAGGERARTAYRLTEAGRSELARWVEDAPFEEPTIRHPAALRLFLGHVADRDRVIEVLEQHRAWVTELLADLAEVDAAITGDDTAGYAGLVARWGTRFYGTERRATAEALGELRATRTETT